MDPSKARVFHQYEGKDEWRVITFDETNERIDVDINTPHLGETVPSKVKEAALTEVVDAYKSGRPIPGPLMEYVISGLKREVAGKKPWPKTRGRKHKLPSLEVELIGVLIETGVWTKQQAEKHVSSRCPDGIDDNTLRGIIGKKPLQQNLWVPFGSGRAPSA